MIQSGQKVHSALNTSSHLSRPAKCSSPETVTYTSGGWGWGVAPPDPAASAAAAAPHGDPSRDDKFPPNASGLRLNAKPPLE